MSKRVISIRNVGKRYRLGKQEMQFISSMLRAWTTFRRRTLDTDDATPPPGEPTFLWALQDVSLDVYEGDVVGIVGKNGSGKSTLLKILSRITPPTTGEIDIYGRLGSLLEVGTGFHPELTGRENIFLNGTLLGMTRVEIQRKLDDIVGFAELDKFLDTPVKRYSSGMYVRLAFAVAAHLETEILVLDEVLSVGDQSFTRRCLGKVSEVARSGRTCLVVSHNLPVIQNTCTRAVLLDSGKLIKDGTVSEVLRDYAELDSLIRKERSYEDDLEKAPTFPDGSVRLLAVRALGEEGICRETFDIAERFLIEVDYEVLEPRHILFTQLRFFNEVNQPLLASMDTHDSPFSRQITPVGRHRVRCHIPTPLLTEGMLKIDVSLVTNPASSQYLTCREAIILTLREEDPSRGIVGPWQGEWPIALVRPRLQWSHEPRLRQVG